MPALQNVLRDLTTAWSTGTITNWYREPERTVEVCPATVMWSHPGMPLAPIRRVLIRDPQDKFRPQAWLSADLTVSPSQIVTAFVQRWQLEAPFQAVRTQLGVEPHRQWADLASARMLRLCWGCSPSLSCSRIPWRFIKSHLLDRPRGTPHLPPPLRMPWLSFARSCGSMLISLSQKEDDLRQIPRPLFECLTDTLCDAA